MNVSAGVQTEVVMEPEVKEQEIIEPEKPKIDAS